MKRPVFKFWKLCLWLGVTNAGRLKILHDLSYGVVSMKKYDKEFLDYMKNKYKITLKKATNGSEMEIIRFAIAWDVWKQAKKVYSHSSA